MNAKPYLQKLSPRVRILLVLVTLGVIALVAFLLLVPPGLQVTFIDVGRGGNVGDSILFQTTEGKVMLIDGGEPNTGALEYLQAHGIDHIDIVLLTHHHQDHYGGLTDVLRSIPVDLVITNGDDKDEPLYLEFKAALQASGAKTRVVKSGDKISLGRLTFHVLSPRKLNPSSTNNNSIVMRLPVGRVVFLFTGDMMELEEGRLIAARAPLKATILKIAHHAADTSSTGAFLTEVKPKLAIYSVGVGNIHGFPHQSTLDDLAAVGAEVYGTDEYGTIVVHTDGWSYDLTTERDDVVLP